MKKIYTVVVGCQAQPVAFERLIDALEYVVDRLGEDVADGGLMIGNEDNFIERVTLYSNPYSYEAMLEEKKEFFERDKLDEGDLP